MVVDARDMHIDMDPDATKEYQRRFAAVQATVRQMRFADESGKIAFVGHNLPPANSRPDGFTPFILFHRTDPTRKPRFELRILNKPIGDLTDEQSYALIEASFKAETEGPFFLVREGRLGISRDRVAELRSQGLMPGSGEAMEVVLEVINPEAPAVPKPPAAV